MSDSEGGFMGSNAVGAILSKTQNQLKNIGLDIDLEKVLVMIKATSTMV